MAENESHDFFGSGLRAHLERLSADAPEAPGRSAGDQQADAPRPPTLEAREQALIEREQRFDAHVHAFEAHAAALAQHEHGLREREQALEHRAIAGAEERRAVRDALRDHAESSLARVVQVFDDALTATQPNGAPDHAVRLAAVRTLLGEAYPAVGGAAGAAAAMDELAALRQRRFGDG